MMSKKTVTKGVSKTGSGKKEVVAQPRVPEETIRKLSDLLKTTDLAEIEVSIGDLTVRVRGKEQLTTHISPSLVQSPSVATTASRGPKVPDVQSDLHIIRSPFIGTFYRAASPTSAVFVEVNQSLTKGQTLCIVEAMKLMNEIESDCSGVLEKIFVENGTPVEFNQPLFGIRK
jgi:acetyl-CoA carboxylase biotin carboxyl carrier protein